MSLDRLRRRSMGTLDAEGESWSCFLVTYIGEGGRWRGYLSFRPRDADEEEELRTAEIFLEDSESLIDGKARGLGRPLLSGLLASALHAREGGRDAPPRLRRWFRTMLQENAREVAGPWEDGSADGGGASVGQLRDIYASYRLDQVAHFITLVRTEDFDEAVTRILEGKAFDFGAKDRLQFAMMVIEYIERRLPLPPFEVWAEDYLAHPEEYRLYAHTLHRTGRLP